MYVVVRSDMPACDQAVQAAHALADFATEHPKCFKKWNKGDNTLVLLQAKDERHLLDLAAAAKDGGFAHTKFVEPGLTNLGRGFEYLTTTAVAFAPNWFVQNVLLADLPLALPMSRKEKRRYG